MQWLELTIQTASSGIEALGAHLTAQGYDSFVIDDQIEYEAFLENNRAYWDYIDEELEKRLGVPVINGLSETASYLAGEKKTCVGILATDGTIRSGVLQNMLRERGIRSIVPEENSQKKVMAMVYDEIKAGHRADMEKFEQVSGELFRRGAQVILLACTELSLIKKEHPLPAGYLDILEVMALAAVEKCHRVRVEFRHLITE